ncbi:MAG: hypothetical protein R2882_09640 [Gemmatimonadales bacterium]
MSTTGYPSGGSSGMCSKFMPYTPARNVSGMKLLAMMVSTFDLPLRRWLCGPRQVPSREPTIFAVAVDHVHELVGVVGGVAQVDQHSREMN